VTGNLPLRQILRSGPEDDQPSEPAMKFRLTYEGSLRPTQRDPEKSQPNPLAIHKQEIRRCFHRQLRHLWSVNKFLREHEVYPTHKVGGQRGGYSLRSDAETVEMATGDRLLHEQKMSLLEATAAQYHMFGYRFVPLVREEVSLLCSLDVLFLRRDIPGSALNAGDIDNRIKTLIDTLRIPRNQTELIGPDTTPGADDDPFFCLLEDDKQVSRFVVETDTLLNPPAVTNLDDTEARVVVTVELRPYDVTLFNLSFS
jgi:hypothetical protein